MRQQRVSRSATLIVLLSLGAAVLFTFTGRRSEGASVFQSSGVSPDTPSECENGTVESYIHTVKSCFLTDPNGTTTFTWNNYTCSSKPASICTALGNLGSNVGMCRDSSDNTLLVVVGQSSVNCGNQGKSTLSVAAGQMVVVTIMGTVSGANGNLNWPHFGGAGQAGQTGDGVEENITTVSCGANCTTNKFGQNLNGMSDIRCDQSDHNSANCMDSTMGIGPYEQYMATFHPAGASNPYPLTIQIGLSGGGSGSAALYSVGTHIGVCQTDFGQGC